MVDHIIFFGGRSKLVQHAALLSISYPSIHTVLKASVPSEECVFFHLVVSESSTVFLPLGVAIKVLGRESDTGRQK